MLTPVDPQGAIVLRVDGQSGVAIPEGPGGANAFTNVVSPGWFRTFGVPLLAGRDFDETDGETAPRVAIVNETLARAFAKGESPVGRTIAVTIPARTMSMAIVGVVGDAVYRSLRETVPPTIYTPLGQLLSPSIIDTVRLSVRATAGTPATLTRTVVSRIGDDNPELTLTVQPLA